nr:N-terminal phage integrase SAM-like domain-containing protein [Lentzea indica]
MPRKKRPEGTRAPNGASSIYHGADGKWHGRVTMGTLDNGKPDRRHVKRATEAEVITAVRDLERQRDSGKVKKAGRVWTVEKWLTHWVENIAAPTVRATTMVGYRASVNKHLIPGIGAHRIDRLRPEHLEKLYARMIAGGLKPGTAHLVHRTVRAALNEAVRRRHLVENPATMPRLRVSRKRRSFRSRSMRPSASWPRRAACGTAHGSSWLSRLACGVVRLSACAGPT